MSELELTLKQIADWQINPQNQDTVIAGIPSLQRGAVWEPQQIEMLWDSIFRGFPFGSLVLAEKIDAQETKSNEVSSVDKSKVTHHLLDGQQRCNAIAWGYANPWQNDEISSDQILWLDLEPDEKKLAKTSKQFFFRVTTKAHPWGFSANEESTQLSTAQIRKSVETKKSEPKENGSERPKTKDLKPYDANLPIPLSYLMAHFDGEKVDIDKMLEQMGSDKYLTLENDDFKKQIEEFLSPSNKIINGLKNAFNTQVSYLLAPENASIDDIEQMFIRLNRQGTILDPEELAYSMIKAMWPEIEKPLSEIKLKHTTDARMVSMLLRAKRTTKDSKKLATVLTVDQIRQIFKGQHKELKPETFKEYLSEDNNVQNMLDWIDNNLVFDNKKRRYGMPKYLRSSIAWSSKEVFIWWLVLSQRYAESSIEENIAKNIIWLSLAIHWFAKDKERCVNKLLTIKESDIDALKNFDLSMCNEEQRTNIVIPISPEKFDAAIKLNDKSSDEHLIAWKSFWTGIVKLDDQGNKNQEDKMIHEGLFFEKLRNLRELLIYTQREYIESAFSDFDPSNKLMWKGYNRPWDYDHILPSNSLNAQGKSGQIGKFHEVCKAWQSSIGNIVAVDFSFNRSAQDTEKASEKYDNDAVKKLLGSFDGIKLTHFDLSLDDTNKFDKSKEFVLSAYQRMKNLYEDWYVLIKSDQDSISNDPAQ